MTLIKQIWGHKKESNDIRKNKNSVTGAGRLLFCVDKRQDFSITVTCRAGLF